jgi:threonine/homoserine/homoserine lactone efflux protein
MLARTQVWSRQRWADDRTCEVTMAHTLTSIPTAFLAASLVIAVTPGAGVFYIVTRSAAQGRPAGLASVAGVALGNLGNATAASLGLATLFAISTVAFTAVKYAGALYLIYLGIRTIRSAPASPSAATLPPPSAALRRIFMDGFLVALFNPKTAIFFAAFVPQFLDASTATPVGTVELSVVFVVIAATTDSIYALSASTARRLVVGKPVTERTGRYLSGGAFIALGLFTAISGRRTDG